MASKTDLFLKLAGRIDKDGFSRKVAVSEFVGEYACLRFGNGADWARKDGSLGRRFNVVRYKEGRGNAITHVQLQGKNKTPKHRPISKRVRDAYKGERCRVLGVGRVQIDHKDGRYDDSKVASGAEQEPADFQPLSECVNYAKRQHCKECASTGNRFDARRLGYRVGQVKGNGTYHGTCIGCYWYDPVAFNQSLIMEE